MDSKNVLINIEETGNRFKKELRALLEKAEKSIDSKIYLSKFEAAYSASVSKEKREKTMKELKDIRERLWKKSLEKANGDTNLAFSFYEKACDFS